MIKTITAYQTNDNRMFTSLEEADDHEYSLEYCLQGNSTLTRREQETFNYLTKTDLQTNLIAEKMGVTPRTIKAFCTSIYKKLEVKDRLGLLIKSLKD